MNLSGFFSGISQTEVYIVGIYCLSEEKCGRNIVKLKFLEHFSSHLFKTPTKQFLFAL